MKKIISLFFAVSILFLPFFVSAQSEQETRLGANIEKFRGYWEKVGDKLQPYDQSVTVEISNAAISTFTSSSQTFKNDVIASSTDSTEALKVRDSDSGNVLQVDTNSNEVSTQLNGSGSAQTITLYENSNNVVMEPDKGNFGPGVDMAFKQDNAANILWQDNSGNNLMKLGSNGGLGLGTNETTDADLNLNGTQKVNNNKSIYWGALGGSDKWAIRNNTNEDRFEIKDLIGSNSDVAYFNENGDVEFPEGGLGVNTTSPDTALEVNGDITVSNTLSTDISNNQILAADGTGSNPGYSFKNNTGMGLFRKGNKDIALSANSSANLLKLENGNFGLNPDQNNWTFTVQTPNENHALRMNTPGARNTAEFNVPLGINTSSPDTALEVDGAAKVSNSVVYPDGVGKKYGPTSPYKYAFATEEYNSEYFSAKSGSEPKDMDFNKDGTKLYVLDTGNDDVNEYDLSTAYDVSSASLNQAKDISNEEDSAHGMAFSNDGKKMFITGWNGTIYEYKLSTPFDVSTASVNTSISAESSLPSGLEFNNDGTVMIEVGVAGTDTLYEQKLSTPFDLSTANYTGNTKTAEDSETRGIAFNNDGTRLYEVGWDKGRVYEVQLNKPFDITTKDSVTSITDNINGEIQDMAFNRDGSKRYEVDRDGSIKGLDLGMSVPDAKVGIGTKKPGSTLEVNGTGKFNGDVQLTAGNTVSTTASTDDDRFLSMNTSDSVEFGFRQKTAGSVADMDLFGPQGVFLRFLNSDSKMKAPNGLVFNNDSIAGFGNSADYKFKYDSGGTNFELNSSGSSIMQIQDGNTNIRTKKLGVGFVGSGNSDPKEALSVRGNLKVQDAGSVIWGQPDKIGEDFVLKSSGGGTLTLREKVGGNQDVIEFNNGGNIGINTSSPDTTLEMKGTATISDTIDTDPQFYSSDVSSSAKMYNTVDTSGSSANFELEQSDEKHGREINVRREGANSLTVTTDDGTTVNGSTSDTIPDGSSRTYIYYSGQDDWKVH